ncbi:hypothetical protein D5F01_LYC05343 [Larimichthys crocea]|uniref:Uncharacterized protein n=1 Tax=Larimichthys crocea TaxID=215358 RepID=A0A6G0IZ64_LARCR|nr:hypothetical protein D5F01_LYC05343 [Larimichthys crocea]
MHRGSSVWDYRRRNNPSSPANCVYPGWWRRPLAGSPQSTSEPPLAPASVDLDIVDYFQPWGDATWSRDLYDRKRLPPAKQLLPAVLACMAEMSRFWSSPFKSKVTTQGYSKLEVHGMAKLGLAEPGCGAFTGLPPPSELPIYLISLPGETGHTAAGLGDTQKAEVMDTAYDPTKGLFGTALEKMRETSTERKQEGEAFELCLLQKQIPRPPPRTGFAAVAAEVRGRQGDARPAHRQGAGHGD